MKDFADLADLSHGLERLGLALARDDPDDARSAAELDAVAGGQKDILAVALSYALRRQRDAGDDAVVARAVKLLSLAIGVGRPGSPGGG